MKNKNTKHYILTGLFSILPIASTYWIIMTLFQFFSDPGAIFLKSIFNNNIPIYIPEIAGFILTLLIIYLIGLIVSNVVGNRIYNWIENIFSRIPVVSTIYKTIKQITSSISNKDKQSFKKVVFIEYPRKGIWTMSMVTGESINSSGDQFYHIFVPTTPNPTSGFMLYVLKNDTQETNISIEEGLKIIISGGMLAPNKNNLNITNESK